MRGSGRIGALAAALLGAAVACLLGGCGYIAAGLAAAIATGGGAGGGSRNARPVVSDLLATTDSGTDRDADGLIQLSFTVSDPEGDPVRIEVEVAPGGGDAFTLAATAAAASPPTEGLAAPPGGQRYTPGFVWDYGAQLGPAPRTVALRVRVFDAGGEGTSARTSPLLVGNDPPELTAVAIDGTSGNVIVRYTLRDSTGDLAAVRPSFSIGGGPFQAVAPDHIAGGVTSALVTRADGSEVSFDFTWRTFAEPELQGGPVPEVRIALVPSDAFAEGATLTSDPVTIDNGEDTPPIVAILGAGTESGIASLDGRIPVRFALFDNEAALDPSGPSGLPAVTVEVLAPGAPFQPATGLVVRHGGRELGLASTEQLRAQPFPLVIEQGPESNVHTFLWDALADGLGGLGELNVVVRITPQGGTLTGQPALLPMVLGEDAPLLQAVDPPLGIGTGGALPAALRLADLNEDGLLDLVHALGAVQGETPNGGFAVHLASPGHPAPSPRRRSCPRSSCRSISPCSIWTAMERWTSRWRTCKVAR